MKSFGHVDEIKGGSDGGAGGAWAPPLFKALFKNSMLLENNGDCGFQLSTKAIVTNIRWLIIVISYACKNRPSECKKLPIFRVFAAS